MVHFRLLRLFTNGGYFQFVANKEYARNTPPKKVLLEKLTESSLEDPSSKFPCPSKKSTKKKQDTNEHQIRFRHVFRQAVSLKISSSKKCICQIASAGLGSSWVILSNISAKHCATAITWMVCIFAAIIAIEKCLKHSKVKRCQKSKIKAWLKKFLLDPFSSSGDMFKTAKKNKANCCILGYMDTAILRSI